MNENSNIGIVGVDSVRVGGRRIENLPIAEAARAKDQISNVIEADRLTKVSTIKGKYPPGSVVYYEACITECQVNIIKLKNFRIEQQTKINEYISQLSMCSFRDQEIVKLDENESDYEETIKDLNKRFPPYNVAAMKQQISQFEDACNRCDDVITQENASIAKLSETIGLVRQRDMELKNFGE